MAQRRMTSLEEEKDPIPFHPDLLSGYVYLVRCKQYYKIGYTKRLGSRITSFRVDNPFPCELIHSVKVNYAAGLERLIHEKLEDYLHRGEWFVLPTEAISLVINQMNNYGK